MKKTLVRALAYCHDCDWEENDWNIAQKEARKHAMQTGHCVTLEAGYIQTYNPRGDVDSERI